MVPALFFYQFVLVARMWLCLMLQWAWPSDRVTTQLTLPEPTPPQRKRRGEPKPFAGFTTKPHCAACAHASAPIPQAYSAPPPRIVTTRGRRHQVDTSQHFCPDLKRASHHLSWWVEQYLQHAVTTSPASQQVQRRDLGLFLRYL